LRWQAQLKAFGLPAPDRDPLVGSNDGSLYVWREHYAAALIGRAGSSVARQLEDMGFEVIVFERTEADWADGFRRLATTVGRVS